MSSIQVLVKAELLGTPISGVYNKSDVEHATIKTTDPIPLIYTATTTLIYGAPEEPTKKSLTAVLSELSFGLVKEDDIKNRVPEKVFTFLKNTNVELKTVYYLKKTNTTAIGKDKFAAADLKKLQQELGLFLDPVSDKAAVEEFNKKNGQYAFYIEITLDEETQKEFPLKVSSLAFKIWKTNNQQVLDKMGITEINKLLDGAGVNVPAIENK